MSVYYSTTEQKGVQNNRIRRTAILLSPKGSARAARGLFTMKVEQETGIKATDWEGRFWARWGDALREAALEPNQVNAAYEKTMLKREVAFAHA